MPISDYSLGNNYFSRIMPSNSGSFLQWNASAPVSQVFAVEKIPMQDGNYARIVTVPAVRVLNSYLVTGMSYYEFYLPCLVSGSSPYLSQSVTLTGSSLINFMPRGTITQVRINATAVNQTPTGFNNAFFNFDSISETTSIPAGASIEFYVGTVEVSIGMAS
jgi:hypothetical protein